MLFMATACSFWPLFFLAEIKESNSDVGVIVRHTVIVRPKPTLLTLVRSGKKKRQDFQNLFWPIVNPKVQQHYYTTLVLTQCFPNIRTLNTTELSDSCKKSAYQGT
jgi:hypothetical protein